MARPDPAPTPLDRDLADLKLLEIAKHYREVLDDAARKGCSLLEVLTTLIGMEQTLRQQRALERRLRQARLPEQKTLVDYDFNFPKRVPKTAIVRLFDGDFIPRHGCAVLIGPTGTGKTHLLTALGYTACERGYSVRYTRVVDRLNHLTTAQINGLLANALKTYVRPQVLLLDELGYLPIDKRGADRLFQEVAARYESGSIVLTTNRPFREWGTLFDVDNTLATALIDRLMHHGEALVIKGDSYRMKDKPPDPPSARRWLALRPLEESFPQSVSIVSCVVPQVQPTHEQPAAPAGRSCGRSARYGSPSPGPGSLPPATPYRSFVRVLGPSWQGYRTQTRPFGGGPIPRATGFLAANASATAPRHTAPSHSTWPVVTPRAPPRAELRHRARRAFQTTLAGSGGSAFPLKTGAVFLLGTSLAFFGRRKPSSLGLVLLGHVSIMTTQQ